MKARGLVAAAAAVVAVGVVAAATVAVVTRVVKDESPAAEAPPIEVALAPGMLEALQRDLGLSEEEAYERLRTEAWAGQTTAALRRELGDERFAGAWLDDGRVLRVAVTDEAAADLVRSAGAEPVEVPRGAAYLEQVLAALDEHAPEIAEAAREVVDYVAGWYVDVTSNRVVVKAPPEAEAMARDLAEAAGEFSEAIEIVFTDERPRLFNDIRGGDEYVIANAAYCSVGFAVQGGFITAGHCALAGNTVSGSDGTPMGEFVAVSFPGVGEGGPDDWGVVAVDESIWAPQPVVNDYQGGLLPVAGAVEAPIGASVCRYGRTTYVACGEIVAYDATVIYPEGTVTGMTQTTACSEPGDSGGAWLSGDQAQGVTSGGSGDCTVGGITYFQPLDEILDRTGVTLLTTTGGTEPPPPPDEVAVPSGGCDSYDYVFEGQLAAPDYVSVEPGGRYFRVLATGTQTICMSAPEGVGFYLILQQWDGETWQNVAESAGPTSSDQLTFTGGPGYYRIGVVSESEAGGYQVGLGFERS